MEATSSRNEYHQQRLQGGRNHQRIQTSDSIYTEFKHRHTQTMVPEVRTQVPLERKNLGDGCGSIYFLIGLNHFFMHENCT